MNKPFKSSSGHEVTLIGKILCTVYLPEKYRDDNVVGEIIVANNLAFEVDQENWDIVQEWLKAEDEDEEDA